MPKHFYKMLFKNVLTKLGYILMNLSLVCLTDKSQICNDIIL